MVLRNRRRFLATAGTVVAGSAVLGRVGLAQNQDVRAALFDTDPLARSGWPTAFGGPGHAGTAAWTSGPGSKPTPAWSFDFELLCPSDDESVSVSGLAVVDDTAYLGLYYYERNQDSSESGAIVALDVDEGSWRWSVDYEDARPLPPAVADGRVFVVDRSGEMRALAADSGEEIWRRDVGVDGAPNSRRRPVSDVTVANAVYVSGDATYALDLETEEVRWTSDRFYWPSTDGRQVYGYDYRNDRQFVVAVDAETGEEQWRFRTRHPAGIPDASPLVQDGLVLGRSGDVMYGIDTESGEEAYQIFGEDVVLRHALGPDRLYGYAEDQPFLHAHDANNGDFLWQRDWAESRTYIADGEALYASVREQREQEGGLLAFNGADGTVRWRIESGGGPLAIADGTLYVRRGGSVSALR